MAMSKAATTVVGMLCSSVLLAVASAEFAPVPDGNRAGRRLRGDAADGESNVTAVVAAPDALLLLGTSSRVCREWVETCEDKYTCSSTACGVERVCEDVCKTSQLESSVGPAPNASEAVPLIKLTRRECREWYDKCENKKGCSASGERGVEQVCESACRRWDFMEVPMNAQEVQLTARAVDPNAAAALSFARNCRSWTEQCRDEYACSGTGCGIERVCEDVCASWSLTRVDSPGLTSTNTTAVAVAVEGADRVMKYSRRECREWFDKCEDAYSCSATGCGIESVCERACKQWELREASRLPTKANTTVLTLLRRECANWTTTCQEGYGCGSRGLCGVQRICEQSCTASRLLQDSVALAEASPVALARECRTWTTECQDKYTCASRGCGVESVCEPVCRLSELTHTSVGTRGQ